MLIRASIGMNLIAFKRNTILDRQPTKYEKSSFEDDDSDDDDDDDDDFSSDDDVNGFKRPSPIKLLKTILEEYQDDSQILKVLQLYLAGLGYCVNAVIEDTTGLTQLAALFMIN